MEPPLNKKCEKSLDDLGKQLEQVKQHETSLLSGLKSHQETIQKLEIQLTKVTQEKNTLDQYAKELHEDLIASKIKFETQQSVFTQLQSMLAMQKSIKPYD